MRFPEGEFLRFRGKIDHQVPGARQRIAPDINVSFRRNGAAKGQGSVQQHVRALAQIGRPGDGNGGSRLHVPQGSVFPVKSGIVPGKEHVRSGEHIHPAGSADIAGKNEGRTRHVYRSAVGNPVDEFSRGLFPQCQDAGGRFHGNVPGSQPQHVFQPDFSGFDGSRARAAVFRIQDHHSFSLLDEFPGVRSIV